MIEKTLAMTTIIGTINKLLPDIQGEIQDYGIETAHTLHALRAETWVITHQDMHVDGHEELIAVLAMSTALQFVAVLFATGEIRNAR